MNSQNEPVIIYGMDHSPWVQTVLMTCHIYGVPYRLMSRQLSLANYRRRGMVMPEVRFPDGSIVGDSFEIIREVTTRYGIASVSSLVRTEDIPRLERLFFSYALRRGQSGRRMAFIRGWSKAPSTDGSLSASSYRALMCSYFFALILAGRQQARRTGFDPDHSETLLRLLEGWESRLGDDPFLDGSEPGLTDLALMGHIQCMATGLTDDVLAEVKRFPMLCAWAEEMSRRLETYPHNFARRLVEPDFEPPRATLGETATFWATGLIGLACLPVSLVVLGDAFRRRESNPNRSGERLR